MWPCLVRARRSTCLNRGVRQSTAIKKREKNVVPFCPLLSLCVLFCSPRHFILILIVILACRFFSYSPLTNKKSFFISVYLCVLVCFCVILDTSAGAFCHTLGPVARIPGFLSKIIDSHRALSPLAASKPRADGRTHYTLHLYHIPAACHVPGEYNRTNSLIGADVRRL